MPWRMASAGARKVTALPSSRIVPAPRLRQAEDRPRDLGAARADQPGESENLARADVKLTSRNSPLRVSPRTSRHHLADGRWLAWGRAC